MLRKILGLAMMLGGLIIFSSIGLLVYRFINSDGEDQVWIFSSQNDLFSGENIATLAVGDSVRGITFTCSPHEKSIIYNDRIQSNGRNLEGGGEMLLKIDGSQPIRFTAYSTSNDGLSVQVEAVEVSSSQSNDYYNAVKGLESAGQKIQIGFRGISIGNFSYSFTTSGARSAAKEFLSNCNLQAAR